MSAERTFARGDTRVSRFRAAAGAALAVDVGGDVLLIDAPAGIEAALADAGLLGRVRAIVCTSGRIGAVGGLVPLLCALEPHRTHAAPLDLHVALGEERAATLAEVWLRGWGDPYPLSIDAQRPGGRFTAGAVEVATFPARIGEVRFATGDVTAGVGMGLRLGTAALTIGVVVGAPDRTQRRVCDGVDLAVVEVGVAPWPRLASPPTSAWRLRVDEALALAANVGEVWIVGDDGSSVAADAS